MSGYVVAVQPILFLILPLAALIHFLNVPFDYVQWLIVFLHFADLFEEW